MTRSVRRLGFLEQEIVELLRTWGDRLEVAVAAQSPALVARYRHAFSAGYTEQFGVERVSHMDPSLFPEFLNQIEALAEGED